ncbi:MAG: tRNA lysidine(34) synthetase TilS [Oleispira sp.]
MRQVADAIKQVFPESASSSIHQHRTVWVGLSAGVDSTVLLQASAQYFFENLQNKTVQLKAIHVHHGLSKHADDWASQAQLLCQQLSGQFKTSIECIVEKVRLDDYADGIEQAARQARYQVFEKHCGPNDILLQGHHLDDQIETFFMRALRGSGLKGLTGIPAQRNLSRADGPDKKPCQIIRPFLSIEKTQLIAYANLHQLSWVEDESNQDIKIERNWWRNHLLPQIWQYYGNKKHVISRSMKILQQEQALLSHFIQQEIKNKEINKDSLSNDNLGIVADVLSNFPSLKISNIPKGFESAYLRAWFSQYVDLLPSANQMKAICDDFIFSDQDANPYYYWASVELRRYRGRFYLMSSLLTGSELFDVNIEGNVAKTVCRVNTKNKISLRKGCYHWRYAKVGDHIKVSGRPNRKLKKYWQELGVPTWLRDQWPLLVDDKNDNLVSVLGLLVAEAYQPKTDGINTHYSWSISSAVVSNRLSR